MPSQAMTTIVFDLGGVLIDWNPRHLYRKLHSDERAIDEFLVEVDFAGWNAGMDRGRPMADGVRELKQQFPHRAEWIDAWMQRWRESLSGPIPGTASRSSTDRNGPWVDLQSTIFCAVRSLSPAT